MTPVELVQRQLDTYNAQDLEGFLACYSSDVVVADFNGAVTSTGIAALRKRYGDLFAAKPQNHARLVNRIAVGNVVIDHEDVTRAPGEPSFQVAAIYTIKDAAIVRVDFAKA
jgi:hypothetical protein